MMPRIYVVEREGRIVVMKYRSQIKELLAGSENGFLFHRVSNGEPMARL